MEQLHPNLILLIEDEQFALDSISKALLKNGYEVVKALTKEEAMEAIERHTFDLIITDIMLPHLGGFDIIDYIRKHPINATTPILVQSGMDKEILGLTKTGADAVITKPYAMKDLVQQVKALLGEDVSEEKL